MSENSENKIRNGVKINFPVFKVFLLEAFLFSLTLSLGILSAWKINEILKIENIPLSKISFFEFLGYFFLFTLFFIFLVYFKKGKEKKGIIFKIIFIFSVFFGGEILLSSLIGSSLISIILMGILIFLWLKFPLIFIHDLIIILGIAGAGAILGLSLEPKIVILFLVIFSVYDIIAVYVTKHMVKIAKEMIKQKVIVGFIFPSEISDFKESVEKVKPGGKFVVLGGGDVIFPLLLCVSLVPLGIKNSLIVAVFALVGLFVSYLIFISQKFRRPIPALPPIAFFAIIGYLITLIG